MAPKHRHGGRRSPTLIADGDLHAKRVLSPATLGVLVSASLAVTAGIGTHRAATEQARRSRPWLLSNQGIDVWEFFGYWVP